MKKYRTDVSPQTVMTHVELDGSYWDPINPGDEAVSLVAIVYVGLPQRLS